MFAVEILNPTEWRDPPQYMDRDDLKHYVKIMKADVKSEKQKLKKSHKFSAGKKRVGKRARGKYHKRDKSERRKRDKKDKSRRRKKDKSRRRKKKTKFSAGNKIPVTHEADKKLSKAAKAWRKASMDCFAENGKATMKIKRLEKKLRKCSRNLTLSRELLKVKKKKSRRFKMFGRLSSKYNDRGSQTRIAEFQRTMSGINPKGEQAGINPKGEQAGINPKGEQAGINPKGEERKLQAGLPDWMVFGGFGYPSGR
jgi:hypothetical protein